MDFGVILFDIIMLLILTFVLGMLVGHKNYDNEKTVKIIIGKNMNFLKMRNREYDSNGSYMYPYGVTWDLDV